MVIFFDLDDTLVDSQGAVSAAVRELHVSLRVDRSLESFLQAWREAHARHYPRYLAGELTYESVSRLRVREAVSADLSDAQADAVFENYMAAYEAKWTLFADVVPCLDELSAHSLGVITNGPSGEQRRKLARFGIDGRFQHIVISEECQCAKPNPEIFHRACQLAGVAAGAVYVGDHYEIDFRGSNAAGLRGIWLNRSGNPGAGGSEGVKSLAQILLALARGCQPVTVGGDE